jgi:glycosyltransferase involved in cell wall biosynthesis
MWPCTGICHHARECDNYQEHCGYCFFLKNPKSEDLSYHIFNKKADVYQSKNITFVTCSNWLKKRAEKSALFSGLRLFSVPNPIDTVLFRPMNQMLCREALNLPTDKQLILFGSMKVSDKRKGIDYMVKAAELLSQKEGTKNIELVIFGLSDTDLSGLFPFNVNYIRFLTDENDMISLYNAADVYVTSSLEENLPNTIMEAMTCGTPCIGFNVGGIPEMIDHKINGYIAAYKSAEDLARGIHYVLNEVDLQQFGSAARNKAMQFYSQNKVAERYVEVYKAMGIES